MSNDNKPTEKSIEDAPIEYGNEEACAWVNGYNSCLEELSQPPQPSTQGGEALTDIRSDCEYFQLKRWEHDCGDCQTDGHYLCAGCGNIAPFEEMELSDNRMRYYPKQEKERQKEEDEQYEKDQQRWKDDLNPEPSVASKADSSNAADNQKEWFCDLDCPDVEFGNCNHPSNCQKVLTQKANQGTGTPPQKTNEPAVKVLTYKEGLNVYLQYMKENNGKKSGWIGAGVRSMLRWIFERYTITEKTNHHSTQPI